MSGRGNHPNSRANLLEGKPFRPGHDERRSVGRTFGRSLIEWLNELTKPANSEDSTAAYPLSELREIAKDETTDHARGTAAALIVAIRDQAWDKLDRMPRSLQTIKEILDRQLGKPTVQVEADIYRASHAHDTWERLGEVEIPVLLLAGENTDSTPPEFARQQTARFPKAGLEIVPDAGHFLPMERPELVANRVRRLTVI